MGLAAVIGDEPDAAPAYTLGGSTAGSAEDVSTLGYGLHVSKGEKLVKEWILSRRNDGLAWPCLEN